jgi:RNA polymerase sigma factor FliA
MTQLAREELAEAWITFHETRTREHRNQLVVHYDSLVRYVAAKVAVGLPRSVDRDDLISYGHFGLMEAVESYQFDRGAKFETFAIPRIWGSIIDELRKIDRVPRSIRAKLRDYERVKNELFHELGHEPTEAELSMAMGLTVEGLRALAGHQHTSTLSSLDEQSDEHTTIGEIAQDRAGNPEDLFGASIEITDLVAEAISTMPERYKTILALYYLQELTLAEIGKVLGVTESRVCQLQGRVLQYLRDALSQGALAAA